ncbi:hypothetical protein RJ45_17020 [Photobacterium gaetbulicola]|uniref:Uncharacterized protein n=1 Tax=Photobacterium gaetbulicola TaxID=1295392 RepID=A0A0B9G1B6_9GAMM|nr:hypothetical protein [Photobacterium gaetbulicola]KHT62518.1 hypothetical protein RJ45_17020 [Photobacterium gaetbulicola]
MENGNINITEETTLKKPLTVSITDDKAAIALSASINAEQSQLIRVPLTSFQEQGLDINSVDVALDGFKKGYE